MTGNPFLAMVDRGRTRGLATTVHAVDSDSVPVCAYPGVSMAGKVTDVAGVTCDACRFLAGQV